MVGIIKGHFKMCSFDTQHNATDVSSFEGVCNWNWNADGRQCVWCCVGERFADVNVVNRVPHGGSGVMIWAGISYAQ